MMKRFFFMIIGALILIVGSTEGVYAQRDCEDDPYSPEFNCGVTQFCDPENVGSGLYVNSYCALQQTTDREEEIYGAVAIQFNLDPGIFADGDDIIEAILKGEMNPAELPEPLDEDSGSNFNDLTNNVIAAYEKEKVIQAMKESFKQEFEASEEWYDATLLNSPMDLVVDLNLIDIMLFGSQAAWNNDVYKFPKEEKSEGPPAVTPSASEESPPSPETGETPPSGPGGEREGPPFDPARDCVPPDSPDAQQPSPGDASADCGNNQVDPGEGCDDGNHQSGDSCSNICTLEGSGSRLCRDPEAVTFKDFEPSFPSSHSEPSEESPPDSSSGPQNDVSCPPGTLPRQALAPTIPRAQEVPQAPNYPGPFIGGVLKEFPPSVQPPCPPGQSEVQVSAGGKTVSTCIPTKLCADFDDSRNFLLGEGWRDDEDKKKIGESIELMFCVEVKKEMRPETPYALNEGCIDCHIRAMVNTLDKLLENNIAPLENTQSAFAISNRWGPKFSFDLNVSVKGKAKLSDLADEDSAIAQASREIQKRRQEQTKQIDPNKGIAHPSSNREANYDELINQYNAFEETQKDKFFENLRFYRFNSDTTKQTQFAGRVGELLVQWRDSFAKIQEVWMGIADSIKFSKKKKCEF